LKQNHKTTLPVIFFNSRDSFSVFLMSAFVLGFFSWSLSGSRLRMRTAKQGQGQDVRPEKTKKKPAKK